MIEPLPRTIEEVIEKMNRLVDRSLANGSRLGYFAALYRRVTIQIKKNIDERSFDNPELLAQLAVTFAGRYFTALETFERGAEPTAPWVVAFEAATRRRPIILQHLLLGMNAHINLDLAIAAAETSPSIDILKLKKDFMQVNAILAAQVPIVLKDLSRCSPLIGLISFFYKHTEEKVAHFSMDIARAFSWLSAEDLAISDPTSNEALVAKMLVTSSQLGRKLLRPKFLVKLLFGLVALVESNDVRKNISALSH